MANDLIGKYFIKNKQSDSFVDVATKFNGVRILKIDGMTSLGVAKNVYTASWEYESEEDFMIVMENDDDAIEIIRECVDIDVTFIVRQKYSNTTIDVMAQHDAFVGFMTNTDVWLRTTYDGLSVHCVCLKEYKPTIKKLHRGDDSWIMGTITLHMLDKPY